VRIPTVQERREDRGLGDLFGEFSNQTATLVRQELELARAEMQAKAATAARSVGLIGTGGVVLHAAFLAVVIAAIAFLTSAFDLDVWLSALLVGVVLALVGFLLIQQGRSALARTSLAPERTLRTLKDDAEWAREQTK
jgi:hypothetical protein